MIVKKKLNTKKLSAFCVYAGQVTIVLGLLKGIANMIKEFSL